MTIFARQLDATGLEEAFYRLYREFFDQAERKRRWSLQDDIPWQQVNRHMPPAIANVVESFCAVELYLPDYIGKALAMPQIRDSRGRAWFHANWGYEESKHSMALGDWLLHSGLRSEEEMADLEGQVFDHEWNLPRDSPLGMILYGMTQELATWLNYRNLRHRVDETGDPALSRLLGYIMVDERCHHHFYKRIAQLYLEQDRAGTLEELRRVIQTFAMPALHMLADSGQRVAEVKALHIFDEEIFFRDVLRPLLDALGVEWCEFRQRNPQRKSWLATAPL
jgi:acyl-[acyl-carrier-protein] desaturase